MARTAAPFRYSLVDALLPAIRPHSVAPRARVVASAAFLHVASPLLLGGRANLRSRSASALAPFPLPPPLRVYYNRLTTGSRSFRFLVQRGVVLDCTESDRLTPLYGCTCPQLDSATALFSLSVSWRQVPFPGLSLTCSCDLWPRPLSSLSLIRCSSITAALLN